MLVICRCLHGSSKGAGDEKLKYYDIPSFPNNDLPLIPTDEWHAPRQPQLDPVVENQEESEIQPQVEETIAEESQLTSETPVEEPLSAIAGDSQPDETRVKEPQPEQTCAEGPQHPEPEREGDRNSLYTCTEILGSESCDNMVTEMSEAVTEWSWSRKPRKQKALDKERKVNMRFPPPIPRYIGRACQFMKIKRRDGKITMSLVQMDRQPEKLQIEREDGQIKMQLMTYVGDAMNNNAEASTSASTSQQVVETCNQETNRKEVEVATDKRNSDEDIKKLAKAA